MFLETKLYHYGIKLCRLQLCSEDAADSNAASCSPVQTNPSQLRVDCVTFQSVVTACIVVGGRPAGELCECVCIHAFQWAGDWGDQECWGEWAYNDVYEAVCETMKAIPLSSESLHSWQTSVIWFSAVKKKKKLKKARYVTSKCDAQSLFLDTTEDIFLWRYLFVDLYPTHYVTSSKSCWNKLNGSWTVCNTLAVNPNTTRTNKHGSII